MDPDSWLYDRSLRKRREGVDRSRGMRFEGVPCTGVEQMRGQLALEPVTDNSHGQLIQCPRVELGRLCFHSNQIIRMCRPHGEGIGGGSHGRRIRVREGEADFHSYPPSPIK